MLTDKYLVTERSHPLGGVQRFYELPNGYGLSLVNSPMIHNYPFAWEVAVLRNGSLVYDTSLTDDVEVFSTEEETNAFIENAFNILEKLPCS